MNAASEPSPATGASASLPSVLLCVPDGALLTTLGKRLQDLDVRTVATPGDAGTRGGPGFDAVLLDLRSVQGEDLGHAVAALRRTQPWAELLLYGDPDNVSGAIALRNAGVSDYLLRDEHDAESLAAEVRRAAQVGWLRRRATDAESLLRNLLDTAAQTVLRLSEQGRILDLNQAACRLLDLGRAHDAVGRHFHEFTVRASHPALDQALRSCAAGEPATASLEVLGHGATRRWIHCQFGPNRSPGGGIPDLIAVCQDVTQERSATERLSYLAQYDDLTGLPNRGLFRDRLSQALARAQRQESSVALLFLDLDRFKAINDTLGHDRGDLLLEKVAQRLRGCVRRSDTVARLGGDEFTVIIENVAGVADVSQVAEKIIEALRDPFYLVGQEVLTATSIGITLYPEHGSGVEELLRHADTAMYRAKQSGRGQYRFYSPEMNADAMQRLQLETALQRAVEARELAVVYQPLIELSAGRIVGLEAQLRWQPPEHERPVDVHELQTLLEDTGQIVPVGRWLLFTTCRDLKAWQHAGLGDVHVTLNLSARQFHNGDIVEAVELAMAENEVRRGQLGVEITEGLLLENVQTARITLDRLRELGLSVAMDEFGAGYSSLQQLCRFPLDTLKIHRSFIEHITTDRDAAAVVASLVGLAHSLRLQVVALGVSSRQQLDVLAGYGCDAVQGPVASPPLDAERIAGLIRKGRVLVGGTHPARRS